MTHVTCRLTPKNREPYARQSRTGYLYLFLYNCDELQVRGEELPAVVLPPPRLALPHRRLQPAADRDDARVLRGRRQVAVT